MAQAIYEFLVEIIGDVQLSDTITLMEFISYICTFLITCIIISPILLFLRNIFNKKK